LKFTVIEPANITLLDCIYKAVQDLQPGSSCAINYAAVCYLMVIRFYGYDQNGKLQAVAAADETVGQSDSSAAVEKYIPFKIVDIKWEVSSRLVSYEFDCQPIGHSVAGATRRGTITADYELNGQTVGELLVGSVAANNVSGSAPAGARSDPNQSEAETNRLAQAGTAPPNAAAAQQKSALRTGLVGVMNDYQQKLVKDGKASVADEYEIVFANGAEKIRDATLFKPGSTTNKGATDMGPAPQQNPSGISPDKGAVNPNSRNQGITAGMQMLQAIDIAIRNSNYITNQASTVIAEGDDDRSEASGTASTTSFSWYHIAMSVQQLGYDCKRNDFAYRVRYTIIPFAPQDFQSQYFSLPKFRGVVKRYPYWFTGENTAVLDYRANFNKLYVQTISGSSVETSALALNRATFAAGMRDIPFIDFQARSTESAQGAAGKANELAASAAEYLYNPADNGQGEITIIGDPAWIQQGSAMGEINPAAVDYGPFTRDGTINYDTQDVLFEIVWQRPEDYDLSKGLADPYARTQDIFGDRQPRQSVIYRVTGITSEFVKGRFQQKIKGVLYLYSVPGSAAGKAATTNAATSTDRNQSNAETNRLAAANSRAANQAANQTGATQSRLGINLSTSAAAAARSAFAAVDPRRADKPAAALSSSVLPSARLAPSAQVNISLLGSGEFSAFTGAAADTVSPLPPARPVSSNGQIVGQTSVQPGAVIRRPAGTISNGALNPPQSGSRDY
jgi:hypothetical protein